MAQLVFLGTSAALPQADRANVMLALTIPDRTGVLMDCGSGGYSALARAGVAPDALGDLFISHAHIDHIGALPSLIESFRLAGRRAPLRIWALPEVLVVAEALVRLFGFELELDSWPFAVQFRAVRPDEEFQLGGYDTRVARMDHAVPSAGLRISLPEGPLVYTSDTQPNPALVPLAQDARLLITEATFRQRDVAAARAARHMTALEAGQQAHAAHVATLVLVHVGGGTEYTPEALGAEAAQAFAGRIIVPHDGQVLDV